MRRPEWRLEATKAPAVGARLLRRSGRPSKRRGAWAGHCLRRVYYTLRAQQRHHHEPSRVEPRVAVHTSSTPSTASILPPPPLRLNQLCTASVKPAKLRRPRRCPRGQASAAGCRESEGGSAATGCAMAEHHTFWEAFLGWLRFDSSVATSRMQCLAFGGPGETAGLAWRPPFCDFHSRPD